MDANHKIDDLVNGIELTTGKRLVKYTEPAIYIQASTTNATLELGYPVAKAGVLNIDNSGYSDGPLNMEQYWPYNHAGFFMRHIYFGSKTWKEIPTRTAAQGMINASAPVLPPEVCSRTSVLTLGDSLTDGCSNGAAWGNAEK